MFRTRGEWCRSEAGDFEASSLVVGAGVRLVYSHIWVEGLNPQVNNIMPRPRRLGSSPSLNRLSRLSSSTSFSSRQSNSRIYVFLIAGGLLLLVTVAFLQVHLLRAPHGSRLSPLENEKSGLCFHYLFTSCAALIGVESFRNSRSERMVHIVSYFSFLMRRNFLSSD